MNPVNYCEIYSKYLSLVVSSASVNSNISESKTQRPAARLLRERAERRVLPRVERKVKHSHVVNEVLLSARLRDRRNTVLHREPVHMPNIVCTCTCINIIEYCQ